MDYPFKRKPRQHQYDCWLRSRDREYFACFIEMGGGKTKVAIDTSAWQYDQGKIDGMFIVAPKGVYRNWTSIEIPKDLPEHVRHRIAYWDSSAGIAHQRAVDSFLKNTEDCLDFFAMNIDAFNTVRGEKAARQFLTSRRVLMIIDEATIIKNPKAQRTKTAIALGRLAKYRRVLTGDPYANSPLDVYSLCDFLSPDALGIGSPFAFRSEFANLVEMKVRVRDPKTGAEKERSFQKITGFRQLDKLHKLVAPFSFTIRKDQCLDLPPKIYLAPRQVTMQPEQARVYEEMRKLSVAEIEKAQQSLGFDDEAEMQALLDGGPAAFDAARDAIKTEMAAEPVTEAKARTSTAAIVLTKLMRLQQIVCGFIKADDGTERDLWTGENPRVAALMEVLEERSAGTKTIIWAPFRRSIDEICAALAAEYGKDSFVRYDGTITDTTALEEAKRRFQEDPTCEFFVGNPKKGGFGLTLTAARLMIFFLNSFSGEIRAQAEDRAHRDGLTHSVSYQDLRVENSVEDHIAEALGTKKGLSAMLRDGSWRNLFK